jgi:hypothetical protein
MPVAQLAHITLHELIVSAKPMSTPMRRTPGCYTRAAVGHAAHLALIELCGQWRCGL